MQRSGMELHGMVWHGMVWHGDHRHPRWPWQGWRLVQWQKFCASRFARCPITGEKEGSAAVSEPGASTPGIPPSSLMSFLKYKPRIKGERKRPVISYEYYKACYQRPQPAETYFGLFVQPVISFIGQICYMFVAFGFLGGVDDRPTDFLMLCIFAVEKSWAPFDAILN
eukprot:scaffold507013_cov15-Prasinocladus_malaysianus.AAC.1